MKKCAIYTRVSTDMQAEKEFNSCETQELKIKRFIESQEDWQVYKVYSDPGFTGANLNRPALQEMLTDAKYRKIDLVISYKIDRLTRSPKDFYTLVEIFEKNNVDFLSITERFDTSTPAGRLMRNIMLMFGAFERELTSERVKDKMLERARQGMWNGGKLPLGYKSVNKRLEPDSDNSKIIEQIFSTYTETGSLMAAYRKIKSLTHLSISNVYDILRNPVYAGITRYDSRDYKGIHAPIVSEDIYNHAQTLHKERPKKFRLKRNYEFEGLIRCGVCGSGMTPTFVNKKKSNNRLKRYFYYRCIKTLKHEWSACPTKQINADKLEIFISSKLETISNDDFYLIAKVRERRGDENLSPHQF